MKKELEKRQEEKMRSLMMTLIILVILYTKEEKITIKAKLLFVSFKSFSLPFSIKFRFDFVNENFHFIMLFRKNKKASSLSTSTSLSTTAAQHCRCYFPSSSPPYSVLICSAADILFRLIEAFVGQVEEVQENCFRQVSFNLN